MTAQRRSVSAANWPWIIYPLACALVVIGAKCWMIGQYGSSTPYWDQWDAEGATLYPRFLAGTLQLSDLLALHNEHRILVARLWALLLLGLNGYWDPLLQMVANSLLLGGAVAALVAAFRPMLEKRTWIVFTLFAAVMFALPFSWENVLAGFNSQWYFLLLFSITGLAAITLSRAFVPRWWIAALLLTLSYFSLASGALSMAAATAVCMVQIVLGRRAGPREWFAVAILCTLTIVMVLNTPAVAAHATLKAQSIGQFVHAMLKIASWPLAPVGARIIVLLLCAALVHAPVWLTVAEIIWSAPSLDDRRWLLIALSGWIALQIAVIAYGRGLAPLESRYLDVYVIAMSLNAVSLIYLLHRLDQRRLRYGVAAMAAVWLLLLVGSSVVYLVRHSWPDLIEKRFTGQEQTNNLRAFLNSGDIKALQNKPFLHIPYPSAERLAAVVSLPEVRAILPPALVGEASAVQAQQRGLARVTGRATGGFKTIALQWGVLLVPAGLLLLVLGIIGQRPTHRKVAADIA